MIDRNLLLILSAISVILLFSMFDTGAESNWDHSGIAYDIRESPSGYTFSFDTSTETFRCFHSTCPVELGYYRICGEFSDDGSMFFVSDMFLMD